MNQDKEQQFLRIIRYAPVVLIVLLASILIIFLYLENKRVFLNAKKDLEKNTIYKMRI